VDEERDDPTEAALIRAFTDFIRSMDSGERPAASAPEALLSITDAARYLAVSTTTVRNLAVGDKVRSTRVGDRIRFRRAWLDEWIDAGGGEIPTLPPAPPRQTAERPPPRPARQGIRHRREPKPKPPTYIQRIAGQEMRLLADTACRGATTWHVGAQTPLCGATGRWTWKLERRPTGYVCPRCLTSVAAIPDADLKQFGVGRVYMMRLTRRGETATALRTGYHTGNGARTLCGKKDGPWALTEREPKAKQCFVCDHRKRWEARDLDPNMLVPRPITPFTILVDAGSINLRLLEVIERHPASIDAWQAVEPLDKEMMWSRDRWQGVMRSAQRLGQFTGPTVGTGVRSDPWSSWMISERPDVGIEVSDLTYPRFDEWARDIERAAVLYVKWAKEAPAQSAARRR